ncbi:hypothetical protein [Coleofasciculus sp. E1-EBD-02]|uniref:hypothetical protein n=2 Tax=unclassified Coleofasciculus TaxID=2692782 RepID=UPI0032FBCD59
MTYTVFYGGMIMIKDCSCCLLSRSHFQEMAVQDTDAVGSDNASLPITDSLQPNLPQFYVDFSSSVILTQVNSYLFKNLSGDSFFLSIYKYILPELNPCFRLKSIRFAGI